MNRIDLSKHKKKTYRVLSGAELGREVRKELNIDVLDNQEGTVTFYIPESVYSLNSSFFSGLFQKSIRNLGEKKFREHYKFECNEIIRENIEDGIFYILNTLNLLG